MWIRTFNGNKSPATIMHTYISKGRGFFWLLPFL